YGCTGFPSSWTSSHSATSRHGTNVVVIAKQPVGALIPCEVISQTALRSRISAPVLPTRRNTSPNSPGKIRHSESDAGHAKDVRHNTIPGIMHHSRVSLGTGAYEALKSTVLPRARIGRSVVVRS